MSEYLGLFNSKNSMVIHTVLFMKYALHVIVNWVRLDTLALINLGWIAQKKLTLLTEDQVSSLVKGSPFLT